MKHVDFAHGMVMETTNYTVMHCSKTKSEAGWLQSGEKKGEKCVVHNGRKKND